MKKRHLEISIFSVMGIVVFIHLYLTFYPLWTALLTGLATFSLGVIATIVMDKNEMS